VKQRLSRVAQLAAALFLGLSGCASGPAPSANADHVAVGRVDVLASPKGWRVIPLKDQKMNFMVYSGETMGDSSPIKRMALVLEGESGVIEALLVIEASPGFGPAVSDGQCRSRGNGMYVSDLSGGSHTVPACVRAWDGVSPQNVIKDGLPEDVVAATQATPDRLPQSNAFVLVQAMNSNGAQTEVTAVLNPEWIGSVAGEPLGAIPNGNEVGRSVAMWADRLGQAAVRSLSAFHNDLVVPPLRPPGSVDGYIPKSASGVLSWLRTPPGELPL
jgi:hypothetical protein